VYYVLLRGYLKKTTKARFFKPQEKGCGQYIVFFVRLFLIFAPEKLTL